MKLRNAMSLAAALAFMASATYAVRAQQPSSDGPHCIGNALARPSDARRAR